MYIGGELGNATQMVWLAERVAQGWVPLALMLGTAYHVIPMPAKRAIWSASMRHGQHGDLLFITMPTVRS